MSLLCFFATCLLLISKSHSFNLLNYKYKHFIFSQSISFFYFSFVLFVSSHSFSFIVSHQIHYIISRKFQCFKRLIQFFFNQNSITSINTKHQTTWKVFATFSNAKFLIFFYHFFVRLDYNTFFFHHFIIYFYFNNWVIVRIWNFHIHLWSFLFSIIFIRQFAFRTIKRKLIRLIFYSWIEWFLSCDFLFHHQRFIDKVFIVVQFK